MPSSPFCPWNNTMSKMIFASKRRRDLKEKSWFREYGESIIIAFIIAMIVRTFVIQAFKIPSGSMEPTLLVGDHLLVSKFSYGIRIPYRVFGIYLPGGGTTLIPISSPKRGDVVVFVFPEDHSKDFIKRVIGLPGETIEIIGKKILVNGKPIQDPWGVYRGHPGGMIGKIQSHFGPVKVPDNAYFMMGDNRNHSYDSRFWGFVDKRFIEGKALILYWSWNHLAPDLLHKVRWNRIGKVIH